MLTLRLGQLCYNSCYTKLQAGQGVNSTGALKQTVAVALGAEGNFCV